VVAREQQDEKDGHPDRRHPATKPKPPNWNVEAEAGAHTDVLMKRAESVVVVPTNTDFVGCCDKIAVSLWLAMAASLCFSNFMITME
jgi:hypothetical protein